MIPQQPSAILQYMSAVILANVSAHIIFTFLHGVFILLLSITIASLLQRGLKSRASQAMLTIALVTFTGATLGGAGSLAFTIIQIQSTMVHNLEMPITERLALSNHETFLPGIVSECLVDTLPIISDGVVIWRAWVIFFENRWVMIGPLMLLLGTITTTFTALGLNVNVEAYIASGSAATIIDTDLAGKFYAASLAFSLATNGVATMMVGYKLWIHRTRLTRVLGRAQRITRAQNILVILIESGLFYLALQLTTITLTLCPPADVLDSPGDIAARVFQGGYRELAAMYPMIVVILVNNERSFVDTYGLTSLELNSRGIEMDNASARPATAGHLSFAPPEETTSELPEGRNDTRDNIAVAELSVTEKGIENVVVNVEERQ